MVASVRCGRTSRAPPVEHGARSSREQRRATGPARAAASSIASGGRRAAADLATVVRPVQAKSGLIAAPFGKSATASLGGSIGYSSPETRAAPAGGNRLQPGVEHEPLICGAASRRCSRLSSTRSSSRSCRKLSSAEAPAPSPRRERWSGHSDGSATPARPTKKTPSAKSSSRSAAAWSVSLVFPPPRARQGQEACTRRRSSPTSASSARARSGVAVGGRLVAVLERRERRELPQSFADELEDALRRAEVFSRCSPRSRGESAARSPRGARGPCETSTWPPCPARLCAQPGGRPSDVALVVSGSPVWIPMRTRSGPASTRCRRGSRDRVLARVNATKNASPWVSTSAPPCRRSLRSTDGVV